MLVSGYRTPLTLTSLPEKTDDLPVRGGGGWSDGPGSRGWRACRLMGK